VNGQRQRDKAARISELLDQLYPAPAIPLQHADPFTLLCAVVLSAQTTDKMVNQVTPALFAAASTPERMSRLPVSTILGLIRQLGLAPQKARALQGLSELLVQRHGSRVPDSFEALCALPGVGRKTANVVLSQAFGRPALAVDTHIHRLAARWGLSKGKNPDQTERDLCRKRVPRGRAGAGRAARRVVDASQLRGGPAPGGTLFVDLTSDPPRVSSYQY
jgi:endonuclease-3